MFYYNNLNLKICKLFPSLRKMKIHDISPNKEINYILLKINKNKFNLSFFLNDKN